MKIIFCSLFFKDQNRVIRNSKIAPSISTHKFNYNIMEGLFENVGKDLLVINNEDYASYPNSKFLFVKKERYSVSNIDIESIGKLNLPILKYLFEYYAYIRKIKKIIYNNPNEQIAIICYGRYYPNVMAVNKLKSMFKEIVTCMVIADLSGDAACKTADNGRFREFINGMFVEKGLELSKQFDCFALISEQMSSKLDIIQKPYTVVEGIVDIKPLPISTNDKKNIVLYSGVLSEQYSVDKLIEAILLLPDDIELHLYGDGPYKRKILELGNEKVKFFGYINNEELMKREVEATILINPRQNTGEYTKYSMPSKNLEYLLSGKPVICYKLDGIPDEYDDYFHYIEGNMPKDIARKIQEILNFSDEQLENIGNRNREFVITQKSSRNQTRKILDLLITCVGR